MIARRPGAWSARRPGGRDGRPPGRCRARVVVRDDSVGPDTARISGATCPYAVYDAASGRCTRALRRAATTDEGGRGLCLVSRCAERRGRRYLASGKIVWTGQSPAGGSPPPNALTDGALLDQWDDSDR
ncbi:hypothetical protein ACIOJD_23465 [Streptomyces sp. NPDC088116]|uniref:hypothetical protein n=1 Tax=Streptomyces sp. NPDC088116 TaxID=3365825 RepID=UPI0037F22E7A